MTVTTLLRFLRGERRAILEIAACPQALWLGLVSVFSAAFAREYDGVDLWPWHLVLPLTVSQATSLLLFLLASVVTGRIGRGQNRSRPGYASFLGLNWMTAPLAWLYAIPLQRLLSPEGATFRHR